MSKSSGNTQREGSWETGHQRLSKWQQKAPAPCRLLPQKQAHKINFLHVSKSVSENMLVHLTDPSTGHAGTNFWWKDFLILDDLGWEGASSEAEFKAQEKHRSQQLKQQSDASNFRQCKRSTKQDGSTLSRINGLALSQTHMENMLERRKWYRDKHGNSPCYPVILTGFRTNGRELHLILCKKHVRGTQPDEYIQRVRAHGFDVLDKRGYSSIGGTDKEEQDDAQMDHLFDLSHKNRFYKESQASRKHKVSGGGSGQINPLAYASVESETMNQTTTRLQPV